MSYPAVPMISMIAGLQWLVNDAARHWSMSVLVAQRHFPVDAALAMQPLTVDLTDRAHCETLFPDDTTYIPHDPWLRMAAENPLWLVETAPARPALAPPVTQVLNTTQLRDAFPDCSTIMREGHYARFGATATSCVTAANSLTIRFPPSPNTPADDSPSEHHFSLRSHLLIASTRPFLALHRVLYASVTATPIPSNATSAALCRLRLRPVNTLTQLAQFASTGISLDPSRLLMLPDALFRHIFPDEQSRDAQIESLLEEMHCRARTKNCNATSNPSLRLFLTQLINLEFAFESVLGQLERRNRNNARNRQGHEDSFARLQMDWIVREGTNGEPQAVLVRIATDDR